MTAKPDGRWALALTLLAGFSCASAAPAQTYSGRPPPFVAPSLFRIADGEDDLQQRIATAERLLKSKVTRNLTQSQFDGLISFAVSAPEAFDGPFLAALNKGDFETATALMLDYDKVRDPQSGGMVVDATLHARRVAERNMILHGIYPERTQLPLQPQDKPWSYHCDGDACAITTAILDDDSPSVVAMRLEFVVDRKAKRLNEILFRLPADARGKTLAFAFATLHTDASGDPHVDLVSGSSRVFTIADCDSKECRLSLPRGLLAASENRPAMDVGATMRSNSQMLINYPSGKDYYRTSVLLSGLQERERQLVSGAP